MEGSVSEHKPEGLFGKGIVKKEPKQTGSDFTRFPQLYKEMKVEVCISVLN